jgi:hypothetical protein
MSKYGRNPGRGINYYLQDKLRNYHLKDLEKTIKPFVQQLIDQGKVKSFHSAAWVVQDNRNEFILYVDKLVEEENNQLKLTNNEKN